MTDLFSPEAMATHLMTLILTAVSLSIMYWVVKKFLYKPLMDMIEKREAQISHNIDDAENRLTQARLDEKNAREKLDAAHTEALQIVSDANSRAKREADQLIDEAKNEAKQLAARSKDEMGRLRKSMVNEVREEVASLSIAIATRLVGEAMDSEAQKAKVDRLIELSLQKDEGEAGRVTAPDSEADELETQRPEGEAHA